MDMNEDIIAIICTKKKNKQTITVREHNNYDWQIKWRA